MRPITYEIEPWIEIRLQPAKKFGALFNGRCLDHEDRWYIWNDLTEYEYIDEKGMWARHRPKFFDTPEEALAFYRSHVTVPGASRSQTGTEHFPGR